MKKNINFLHFLFLFMVKCASWVNTGIYGDHSTLYFGETLFGAGSGNTVLLESLFPSNSYVISSDTADIGVVNNYWGSPFDPNYFRSYNQGVIDWIPYLNWDPNPFTGPIISSNIESDKGINSVYSNKSISHLNKTTTDTTWRSLFRQVCRGDTAATIPLIISRLNSSGGPQPSISYIRWLSVLVYKAKHSGLYNAFINKMNNHSNLYTKIILSDLKRWNDQSDDALALVTPLRNHSDSLIAKEALIRSVLLHIWAKGDFKTAKRDMDTLYARFNSDRFVQLLQKVIPHLMISNIKRIQKHQEDIFWDTIHVTTKPSVYSLNQNFPNPFNPTTNITFSLPENSSVLIEVFDVLGRRISTITDKEYFSGIHTVSFKASHLSSGLYFYKMSAYPTNRSNEFTSIKKMLVMK